LYEETGEERYLEAAVVGAYRQASLMNLFPVVPEDMITVDKGNRVPIHNHSYGRHKLWGFPPPKPFHAPEQTVPAWRPSLIGFENTAYRAEFWMHRHGHFMRLAHHADDDFLRDLGRWGMVGRFANYAGDFRTKYSLVMEVPDAPEHPIWETNYSTFNPGHAWEWAGYVVDFLVSDAFHRSRGQIRFPSVPAYGAPFRVKVYGHAPGEFYGDDDVYLWLPRGLLEVDNKQFDYIAGHGNGKFYLALWNQSFRQESGTIVLNPDLVECSGSHRTRVWRENTDPEVVTITGNQLDITVPPKGIIGFAIEDIAVNTTLQAKMYEKSAPRMGSHSFARTDAPFGTVYGMLLSMGRGLTTAFIYTDALPEDVISARLYYRQGGGDWQESVDAIFPYEFRVDIDEDGGDFQCTLEVETTEQAIQGSREIRLRI